MIKFHLIIPKCPVWLFLFCFPALASILENAQYLLLLSPTPRHGGILLNMSKAQLCREYSLLGLHQMALPLWGTHGT